MQTCLRIQYGVFWTWGVKWKWVIPGLSLQILLVGLKASNWSVQSHFQVTEPEQQRKKKKQNYNNSNNKSFLLTYLPGKPVISIGADNPLFNPIVHSLLQTLSKWNNKIKRTQLQTTQQGKHWGIVLGILKSVKVLFKKKLAALSATFQESNYLVAGIITSHSPQKRKVSYGWW